MQHLGVTGLVVLLLQAFHQVYKRRRNKRIDNLIERQQEEREPPAPHLLWRVRFTQEVLAAVAHRVDALAAPVPNFKNHHLIVRPDIVRGQARRREFFSVERFSCRFGVNGSAVNLDLVRVLNVLPAHRYTLAHPVGLRVVREIADHRIDDELIGRHPVDHKAGNRLRLRVLLIAGDCLQKLLALGFELFMPLQIIVSKLRSQAVNAGQVVLGVLQAAPYDRIRGKVPLKAHLQHAVGVR